MRFRCAHCRKVADKPPGAVNRARRAGLRLFCNRRCAGLGRRKHKSKAQLRAEKKAYDARRRVLLSTEIKAAKAAYHKRTYDPAKERVKRKKRAPAHVEYCRRPEYKRWKSDYDRRLRARAFGPFAESYLLAIDLNREIKSRTTPYEIRIQNSTLNKKQTRARTASHETERRGHRAA